MTSNNEETWIIEFIKPSRNERFSVYEKDHYHAMINISYYVKQGYILTSLKHESWPSHDQKTPADQQIMDEIRKKVVLD